jgi:adenine-specific DNA-methyltransferase
MINLLKQQGGVLFPGGKKLELMNIRPLNLGYLHAEAEAKQNGNTLRVAISFGPQHGPVIAHQVQEAIPAAKVNGYQVLIFAGFAFDPEAQAFIQKVPVAGLQVHFANIAPDVLVGDLLKTTRASQIFTVFGQPDVRVEKQKDGTYRVELRGVDIYDPLTARSIPPEVRMWRPGSWIRTTTARPSRFRKPSSLATLTPGRNSSER